MKNLIIPTKENNYSPVFSTRVAMVVLTLWVLLLNSFSGLLISNFGVYATDMTADRIIDLTNEERVRKGLQPVKANAYLTSAAHAKANNMFEQQYWDHFGPNGESPWQFIKASGYDYIYAGENLGKGFTTSEGVHQAWMASPTHKENILGNNYNDIGIAIVSGSLNNETVILVVQMFGSLTSGVSDDSAMLGSQQVVQGSSDDGKTKSIRITYPEDGETYTDPRVPLRGETTNFSQGSVVEVISENSVIGEVNVQNNFWEFQNKYDWKEGENILNAVIEENSEKYRDSVSFFISSTPPQILEISVHENEGEYLVNVKVDELATEVSLIMGANIIKGDLKDNHVKLTVSEVDLEDKIFLVVSNVHGNFTQEDITEHFFDEASRGKLTIGGFVNFNISSLQRTITVLLAMVVLIILLTQVYFFKKAQKLKEKSGDFLMVGVWWLIFLFGSFIGYSGSIY